MTPSRSFYGKLAFALCFTLLILTPLCESRATNRRVARQTAGEVTHFLSEAFEALKSFSDAVGKYGYNLKHFRAIADALSPALGIAGPLFALATDLIPRGPSPELKAIQDGFKQVDMRFDNVDKKLDEILLSIEKAVVYESYKENQDRLQRVVLKYDQFRRVPGAPASQELIEACSRNDPDLTLDWIYRNCVQDQVGAELLDTIFRDVKYDRSVLLQFFQMILRDYTQSAFMRQVCLGVRFPNATDMMQDNRNQDEQKMGAIQDKLIQFEKMLMDTFYKQQLEEDITTLLEQSQHLSHKEVAQNLKAILETKYFWLTWGAHVYNPIEGYELHDVHCHNTSQAGCQFVWRKFARNVVADWRDKDTTNATTAIQQYKERKDDFGCEKEAQKLNEALWAWEGVQGRNMVLVVQESAMIFSAHGDNEVQTKHCKKHDMIDAILKHDKNFDVIISF